MSNKPPQLRVDGLTSLQLAEFQATVATAGSDYVTTLGGPPRPRWRQSGRAHTPHCRHHAWSLRDLCRRSVAL